MEISIITDEINQEFTAAVQAGRRWGITGYEIRKTGGRRVPEIPQQVVNTILKDMEEYQLRITALSPGLLKRSQGWLGIDTTACPGWWEQRDLFTRYRARALDVLAKTFELARRLKTSLVILFTPEAVAREEGERCPDQVLELIREAAVEARRQGFLLALENEADCWADTGRNTLEIIRAVNEDNLKVNWDPANAYLAGEVPYPQGYEHVRSLVVNVHAKDALPTTDPFQLDYELIGQGKVDWSGQIRALQLDGYTGHVCIETHAHPPEERTRQNLEILRELIKVSSL